MFKKLSGKAPFRSRSDWLRQTAEPTTNQIFTWYGYAVSYVDPSYSPRSKIQAPRLTYLPFLLPRLLAFFARDVIQQPSESDAWFSFEGVPLKWHYPVGLLFDLFSGSSPSHAQIPSVERRQPSSHHRTSSDANHPPHPSHLPWKLTLHFSDFPDSLLVRLDAEGRVLHDFFINSVKEADFLRNGSANAIMKLSKDDSTRLWDSVQKYDQHAFLSIHNKLLPATPSFRNIPLRIYLPAASPRTATLPSTSPVLQPSQTSPDPEDESSTATPPPPTHLKVVQPLVPAILPQTRTQQTVGTALYAALPSLFPSRKTPIQAYPVLHGAVLPLTAPLEEVLRAAAYMDGWLHIGIEMHG